MKLVAEYLHSIAQLSRKYHAKSILVVPSQSTYAVFVTIRYDLINGVCDYTALT